MLGSFSSQFPVLSSDPKPPLLPRLSTLPLTLFLPAQQFVYSAFQLVGAVSLKIKLWRFPQSQSLRNFVPDIIPGGGKPLKRALGFSLVTRNCDHYPS